MVQDFLHPPYAKQFWFVAAGPVPLDLDPLNLSPKPLTLNLKLDPQEPSMEYGPCLCFLGRKSNVTSRKGTNLTSSNPTP